MATANPQNSQPGRKGTETTLLNSEIIRNSVPGAKVEVVKFVDASSFWLGVAVEL